MMFQRLGLNDADELHELLSLFARGFYSIFTAKTPTLQVVKTDPDDSKFIECAVALKAGCIISGDKSLTSIQEYVGIKIMTPRQFLDFQKHESQ